MTDPEQTPEDEPELDPGQEARLRRLLARARHDAPVPDDVAARLDRVLAELRDPAETHRPHDADELAARRRRVAGLLLAAAAAVVVVGVGVHALRGGPGPADSAGSSTSTADSASGTGSLGAARPDAAAPQRPAPAAPEAQKVGGDAGRTTRGLPVLTDARFSDQVRRLVHVAGPDTFASAAGTGTSGTGRCRLPTRVVAGGDRTLDVVYDGAPAALVVGTRQGQSQVVDLVRCGSGQVLRSVTLAR